MAIFKNPTFNFLRWRWPAVALSLLLIVAGAVAMVAQGGPALGIDFAGGTMLVVQFDNPVTEDTVRRAISGVADENVVQQYGPADDNAVLIRLPMSGPEEGASLEEGANAVREALARDSVGGFTVVRRELVGPVIGGELLRRGVSAFGFAMAGILIYIWVRFRVSFAVGAIIAVAHDVLVTLAMLTLVGYELSLNVVAAMLTITGYSVNDSIVVFDRLRENLRRTPRHHFATLVNASINQTLSRTIITSGTTLFAVLALFLFGGEVLRGFAFTMIVGVISGTYSTIFIAAAAAIVISEHRARAATPVRVRRRPRSAGALVQRQRALEADEHEVGK